MRSLALGSWFRVQSPVLGFRIFSLGPRCWVRLKAGGPIFLVCHKKDSSREVLGFFKKIIHKPIKEKVQKQSMADVLQNRCYYRPGTLLKRHSHTGVFLRNFRIF